MKVDQFRISNSRIVYSKKDITVPDEASFVLIFTNRTNLENPFWLTLIFAEYPDVKVISCSTSGEIYDQEITDDSISGIAVRMERTLVAIRNVKINDVGNSWEAGRTLASELSKEDLKYVFLASDGWEVNGTELINGMYHVLSKEVAISGGLAADGVNFAKTMVGVNEDISSGNIVAIAFYGNNLKVGFGTHGGWDVHGETMTLTRGKGRIVYELDGKPALELYKQFLGEDADGLPGTALWYPVSVSAGGREVNLVRTVFSIDELNQTISLGEAVQEGSQIRFMRAAFDNLLTGVDHAAKDAMSMLCQKADLAVVVSCIARKLLFGPSINQEIDAIQHHIGQPAGLIGFYSYGEICPITKSFGQLHHQMLTITVFSEG